MTSADKVAALSFLAGCGFAVLVDIVRPWWQWRRDKAKKKRGTH